METYTCNNCGWSGEEDELVDDNDNGEFDQCPRCGGTDFTVDEE